MDAAAISHGIPLMCQWKLTNKSTTLFVYVNKTKIIEVILPKKVNTIQIVWWL